MGGSGNPLQTPKSAPMQQLPITYVEWRRKMIAATRAERRNGLTPRRGMATTTRARRAYELKLIRAGRKYKFANG